MKKDELKTSKIEDLRKELNQAQKELLNLRIQNETRKLKNAKSISFKKKEIARIETFMRERQLNNAG